MKRLNIELKSVTENLVKSTDNLSKTEKSLNEAVNRGITSDRRLQVYLEQQAKLQSEIEKLTQSQSEIGSKSTQDIRSKTPKYLLSSTSVPPPSLPPRSFSGSFLACTAVFLKSKLC